VSQRQTFLFSATLGLRVKDLAWEYMVDPVEVAIEPESVTVDLVTQELYHVGSHEKLPLLLGVLARDKPESAIIFCNQKFMTEELARRLKINGFDCEYIMGDLPQSKRLEIIEDLKAGKLHFLVATDVAARGLDIEALDMVVNYDIPEEAESYVHRIGRTARAGKAGKAITLACEKFVYGLPAIEKYLGSKIPVFPVTDELLLEDKSQGMRYGHSRSDSKGGRGYPGSRSGSRPEGRADSRSDPRRRGENRPRPVAPRQETSRPETSRPETSRPGNSRQDGGRQDDGRSRGPRPQGRQDTRKPAGAPSGGDPYSLPQDERMRRYKEKYAEGGASPAARDANSREGGNRQGRGQARPGQAPRPDSRDRGQAPKTGRDGSRRDGGYRDGSGRGTDNRPRGGSPAGKPSLPAKKPGILDRIKGIFGGKKSKG
jgi:ATP-dependent RNA helicase RhlB